jgi:hypothetical protein
MVLRSDVLTLVLVVMRFLSGLGPVARVGTAHVGFVIWFLPGFPLINWAPS